MIKEEFIEIVGHSRNKKYYTELGYDIKVGKTILIKSKDIIRGSSYKVTTICSNCRGESKNAFKDYWNYTSGLKEPYYCNSCNVIKSEKTNLEKWGFKNPMQNSEVKHRLKKSIQEKWGVDHYSKTEEWFSKFKETSINKWGYDNPSKSPKIISNIKDKNTKRLKSNEFRLVSKEKKQRNTWKKYADLLPINYGVIKYESDLFILENKTCNHKFEITKSLLYTRLKNNNIICLNCNPINVNKSSFELEVGRFLDEINIDFISNDREILNGMELDYYIPSHNLALECNGVFWHNELFKSSKYHINKTKMCSELGINLIHIWEDDWNHKGDIIKSILKNRLGIIGEKIWARNCQISNVSTIEYKKFLNDNHIQGYASSSYNVGLRYNGELVSLMTFGWRRTNNKKEYELIRFCNKLGISVVGSASKLFNHFIKNNKHILEIISYSDISIFTGLIYKKLGFDMVGLSDPNYFWVINGRRKHRYNYSKRKLIKDGFDPNKTEVEIMHDRGYWRVFSTGQEKWAFRK